MPENMMNSDHKATNKPHRENWDKIRWKEAKPKEEKVTKTSDANEFFNIFVKTQ